MTGVCPCCGHRAVLDALCQVCQWDHQTLVAAWEHGRYPCELGEAQRTYARTGACDPGLVELARPPRPEEARPAWWRSIDDARPALAAEIADAFASVALDGGVSLEEAERIDDHALPPRSELDPPPRGFGHGPPWQQLTRAALERYHWGNFAFQDPRGIRYHLPAYLTIDLRGPERVCGLDSLLFALVEGHRAEAVHRLLTPAQRRAVAQYLALVALDDAFYRTTAVKGLRRWWGADLEPEQHELVLAQVPPWW